MMARPSVWLLLPLLSASGARLPGNQSRGPALSSTGAAAPWAILPEDIVLRVLRLMPGLPPLVAWTTDFLSARVFRVGAEHPEWVAEAEIENMLFWPAGDRVLTIPAMLGSTGAVVWNARTGRPQYIIASEPIFDAQLSAGGDRLATIGDAVVGDKEVVVRDAASGEVLRRFDVSTSGRPTNLRMLGESRLATWGGPYVESQAVASVWDLASGSLRYELRQPRGHVIMLDASPCGAKLVTIGGDNVHVAHIVQDVAYLWDADTGHLQREFCAAGLYFSIARLSHAGRRVVVKTDRGQVFVWDGVTGRLHRQLSLTGALLLLPGGQYIAAINSSEASMWDVETGERLRKLEADALLLDQLSWSFRSIRVAVSACGQLLAACNTQHEHRFFRTAVFAVWHAPSGRLLLEEMPIVDNNDGVCDIAVGNLATMADELLS